MKNRKQVYIAHWSGRQKIPHTLLRRKPRRGCTLVSSYSLLSEQASDIDFTANNHRQSPHRKGRENPHDYPCKVIHERGRQCISILTVTYVGKYAWLSSLPIDHTSHVIDTTRTHVQFWIHIKKIRDNPANTLKRRLSQPFCDLNIALLRHSCHQILSPK